MASLFGGDAVDSIFGDEDLTQNNTPGATQALPRPGGSGGRRTAMSGGRILSAEEQRREAERMRRTESQRVREEKLAQLRRRQAAERKQREQERQARIQAKGPPDCGRPNAPGSVSAPSSTLSTSPSNEEDPDEDVGEEEEVKDATKLQRAISNNRQRQQSTKPSSEQVAAQAIFSDPLAASADERARKARAEQAARIRRIRAQRSNVTQQQDPAILHGGIFGSLAVSAPSQLQPTAGSALPLIDPIAASALGVVTPLMHSQPQQPAAPTVRSPEQKPQPTPQHQALPKPDDIFAAPPVRRDTPVARPANVNATATVVSTGSGLASSLAANTSQTSSRSATAQASSATTHHVSTTTASSDARSLSSTSALQSAPSESTNTTAPRTSTSTSTMSSPSANASKTTKAIQSASSSSSAPLMLPAAPPKTYRIIVMGSGEVGKSTYVLQFIYQHYNPEFTPPSNTYSLQLGVDDRECMIEVLDMQPGESREEFVELFREYMETAAGFVFLFDLTSLGTFEEAEFFREQLVSFRGSAPPIVLVGNKLDDFEYRQVSFEAGQGLGEYLGVPYFEVSAATGEGVEESMVQLIREIRRTEPPPPNPALMSTEEIQALRAQAAKEAAEQEARATAESKEREEEERRQRELEEQERVRREQIRQAHEEVLREEEERLRQEAEATRRAQEAAAELQARERQAKLEAEEEAKRKHEEYLKRKYQTALNVNKKEDPLAVAERLREEELIRKAREQHLIEQHQQQATEPVIAQPVHTSPSLLSSASSVPSQSVPIPSAAAATSASTNQTSSSASSESTGKSPDKRQSLLDTYFKIAGEHTPDPHARVSVTSRTTTTPTPSSTVTKSSSSAAASSVQVSPTAPAERKILPVPEFVPDELRDQCAVCAQAFGLFRRKHHCRFCGEVVCSGCSSHRDVLWEFLPPRYPKVGRGFEQKDMSGVPYSQPMRFCNTCHAQRSARQKRVHTAGRVHL
mmetsp:Transcript_1347/g.4148  ORF Transcript_1347/g.4148 Transcript_1347/m.4148 type:complete len:976 (+) Transcript_1347:157-3084(+)